MTGSGVLDTWRRALWALLLAGLSFTPALAKDIPPSPGEKTGGVGHFTWDFAEVIDKASGERIKGLQQVAFEKQDTPIIVVTINRMRDYDGFGSSTTIEEFARAWFDKWRIGTLGDGSGNNRGILVLVSVGDRRARIELGADWGRNWDAHCQTIMDGKIVPKFKAGDYGTGVADGVQALAEMAAGGPDRSPPRNLGGARASKLTEYSLFGGGPIILMLVAGAGLIAASFFLPEYRKWLLIAGIVLIVGALFTWILLAALAVFARSKTGSGGSGFSGGGFGGGFSGGGGASGGW